MTLKDIGPYSSYFARGGSPHIGVNRGRRGFLRDSLAGGGSLLAMSVLGE